MPSLIKVFENKKFALSNSRISYLMQVTEEGILEHLHFGAAISHPEHFQSSHKRVLRSLSPEFQGTHQLSLHDLPQEYPVFGTSDYRQPALHARNKDGNSIFYFRFRSAKKLDSKPALTGLPSAREGASETLEIKLHDDFQNVSIFLYYTIYQDYDVVTRSSRIVNHSADTLHLEQVFSTCLDLPQEEYEVLHFGGSWAREFGEKRHAIPDGRFTIDSSRGTSSAQHHPFVAVMDPATTETQGQLIGMALVYSGNFAISIERTEFNDVRVLAGINPFNFSWKLDAGQDFVTPEVVHVFSSQGLDNMNELLLASRAI